MFVLRSAFWLTAAFIVVAPTAGTDIGEVSRSAGERIARDGGAMIAAGLDATTCANIECEVGRAVVAGALNASSSRSSVAAAQDTPPARLAPVPPPRPDWAG